MKHALRLVGALVLVLLTAFVVVWAGWNLSGSRKYQTFGELVTRVETADSVVALTFDDGPVAHYTDSVLAMLADSNVRATFFTVGAALRDHPDLAIRITRAGHELGNHSYSHRRLVLKTPGYVRREIEDTDSLIRTAGYRETIYFRPPYFKRLVVLPWILSREDRPIILADLEPDSNPQNAGDAARIVDYDVQNVRPGAIILLHVEIPSRTAGREALPRIIGALHSAGYRFVTVSELLRKGPHS
jgi:peptidoglycan/xylan/chitin deacetylase (PgdA/CDA1 family)